MPASHDSRTIPGLTTLFVAALIFGVAYLGVTGTFASEDSAPPPDPILPLSLANLRLEYFVERQLDTLYVLDTCFLEVRLDSQAIYVHSRSYPGCTFLCSTGNIKIKKAIETTEGIFTVQSKSPLAYSRQFDSTKMYFWVGFNGNIGFHGLDGRSYYRFLGKRPSSHGCIRMAREDAEWMFRNIPLGTPVIVHRGTSARCLTMIDSVPENGVLIQNEPSVRRAMDRQLRTWYRGRAHIDGYKRFYFSHSRVWWGGIALGDVDKLPHRQTVPVFASNARCVASADNAYVMRTDRLVRDTSLIR